mgnify:CR=1 FL=1
MTIGYKTTPKNANKTQGNRDSITLNGFTLSYAEMERLKKFRGKEENKNWSEYWMDQFRQKGNIPDWVKEGLEESRNINSYEPNPSPSSNVQSNQPYQKYAKTSKIKHFGELESEREFVIEGKKIEFVLINPDFLIVKVSQVFNGKVFEGFSEAMIDSSMKSNLQKYEEIQKATEKAKVSSWIAAAEALKSNLRQSLDNQENQEIASEFDNSEIPF